MKRAIRITTAAVIAVILGNTSLKAIDLGKIGTVSNNKVNFDEIVSSSKQPMYLLEDTVVHSDASDVSASTGTETKGTIVNVLEVQGENAEILTSSGGVGYVPVAALTDRPELIFNSADMTKYASEDNVEVKSMPSEDSSTIGTLSQNTEIHVTGTNDYDYWRIEADGFSGYMKRSDMLDAPVKQQPEIVVNYIDDSSTNASYDAPVSAWDGAVLSPSAGTVAGPSGKETYYNLDMSGVVSIMSAFGYSSSDYWVRSDGVKMLGDYVMVAANLTLRPRGSLVATSLGTGIVADTGGFAAYNPTQLDVAVAW